MKVHLHRGVLAALAGAAMLLASSSQAPAFTLSSSPSLSGSALSPDLQEVWWDRWGGWHPNRWGWGWRRPYWHRPYYWRPYYHPWRPYYYSPWRHCWWTPWGRRCNW